MINRGRWRLPSSVPPRPGNRTHRWRPAPPAADALVAVRPSSVATVPGRPRRRAAVPRDANAAKRCSVVRGDNAVRHAAGPVRPACQPRPPTGG